MSLEQSAKKSFRNGQNPEVYESDGDVWQFASYTDKVDVLEKGGVDRIDDEGTPLMFAAKTDDYRVVGTVQGIGPDPAVEYTVDVGVYARDGDELEKVDEGVATILEGTSEQTSGEQWRDHAINSALTPGDMNYIETGVEGSGQGELKFPMDKDPEPTGLDAIDRVQ